MKNSIASHPDCLLSELPQFLSQEKKFSVPVYVVWGACEDVHVLEKFRSGEYSIPNLNIVDELHSYLLQIGDMKIRLLGLGGPYVPFKLFDNGDGKGTIAGGQGTMWTTILQMGELIETAKSLLDREEARIFITHHPIGREGVLSQLATACQADLTLSAGLHFRYGASYNEFCVNHSPEHYLQKLSAARAQFMEVYDTVKAEVEKMVTPEQHHLINNVVRLVSRMPDATNSYAMNNMLPGTAFKNLWNFNLLDASFGWTVFVVENGHVQVESKSHGFNLGYRRMASRRNENYASHIPRSTSENTGTYYYANNRLVESQAQFTKNREATATPTEEEQIEGYDQEHTDELGMSRANTTEESAETHEVIEEKSGPPAAEEEPISGVAEKPSPNEEEQPAIGGKEEVDVEEVTKGTGNLELGETTTEVTILEQENAANVTRSQAQEGRRTDMQKGNDREFRQYSGEQRYERCGFHITPCNSEEEARSYFKDGTDSLITNIQIRTSLNRYKSPQAPQNVNPTNYAYVFVENQNAVSKALGSIKVPEGVRVNIMRDDSYYRQNRGWYRNNRMEGHGTGMRTNRGRGRGGRMNRMQHPRPLQSGGSVNKQSAEPTTHG